MAKRIFLHVGTTKSGTTFLQKVLRAHRRQLRDQGLLLPGPSVNQVYAACLDVREEPHRLPDPGAASGAWNRLVDQMTAWPGDALISHELFAPASSEQATRAIASLQGAEVHLVVTARDLVRAVPAEWQEHLKHRSVLTFTEFVHEVRSDLERGPFSPNGYHFWDEQNLPALVSRWGGSLPAGQVHLVTVPRSGTPRNVLWERYSALLGIEGEGFDLSLGRVNSSLGAQQAELLRRVNADLGSRLPLPGSYTQSVKGVLARQILANRPGTAFGLQGDDHAFAVARARTTVEELRDLHPDVVGDLDELLPDDQPEPGVSGTAEVSLEVLLDEAVQALIEVLDRPAAHNRRRRRAMQPPGRDRS